MRRREPVPRCTCDDTDRCGYCPRIAATAQRESQPYNSPAWQGGGSPVRASEYLGSHQPPTGGDDLQ